MVYDQLNEESFARDKQVPGELIKQRNKKERNCIRKKERDGNKNGKRKEYEQFRVLM